MEQTSTAPESILEASLSPALRVLFARADTECLWFYLAHPEQGNFWLSPAEMRENLSLSRYDFPASVWTLRDPQEFLDISEIGIVQAQNAWDAFRRRIERSRKPGCVHADCQP